MHFYSIRLSVILILLISQLVDASIVFTSDRDGTREIYVMNENGSNVKRLTDNNLFERNPVWSPDGKLIAFTTDVDADPEIKQHDIIIMDADGGNHRNLTNHPAKDEGASWSPDGQHIAFTSNRSGRDEIHIIDITSDNIEQLTDSKGIQGSANDPCWSPDGRYIAYEQQSKVLRATIYLIDVQTQKTSPLIQPVLNMRRNRPRWSPDGKYIMFHVISFEKVVADIDPNKPVFLPDFIFGMTDHLDIMSLDGFHKPRLTIPEEWSVGFITSWSPDSNEIVFSSKPQQWGGKPDIYRYNLTTHEFVNLTNNTTYDGEPNWLNRTLSVTPTGKMVTLWSQIKQQ